MKKCPHCKTDHVIKYGKIKNKQRYRCLRKSCMKTFTAKSYTIGFKYEVVKSVIPFGSIRKTARHYGLSQDTVARWFYQNASDFQIALYKQDHGECKKMVT